MEGINLAGLCRSTRDIHGTLTPMTVHAPPLMGGTATAASAAAHTSSSLAPGSSADAISWATHQGSSLTVNPSAERNTHAPPSVLFDRACTGATFVS